MWLCNRCKSLWESYKEIELFITEHNDEDVVKRE